MNKQCRRDQKFTSSPKKKRNEINWLTNPTIDRGKSNGYRIRLQVYRNFRWHQSQCGRTACRFADSNSIEIGESGKDKVTKTEQQKKKKRQFLIPFHIIGRCLFSSHFKRKTTEKNEVLNDISLSLTFSSFSFLARLHFILLSSEFNRDLFRKRSYRKSKRRSCSPLGTACLSGNGTTNPSTPVSIGPNVTDRNECSTPPTSTHNR